MKVAPDGTIRTSNRYLLIGRKGPQSVRRRGAKLRRANNTATERKRLRTIVHTGGPGGWWFWPRRYHQLVS
jgi:hypothetical protein